MKKLITLLILLCLFVLITWSGVFSQTNETTESGPSPDDTAAVDEEEELSDDMWNDVDDYEEVQAEIEAEEEAEAQEKAGPTFEMYREMIGLAFFRFNTGKNVEHANVLDKIGGGAAVGLEFDVLFIKLIQKIRLGATLDFAYEPGRKRIDLVDPNYNDAIYGRLGYEGGMRFLLGVMGYYQIMERPIPLNTGVRILLGANRAVISTTSYDRTLEAWTTDYQKQDAFFFSMGLYAETVFTKLELFDLVARVEFDFQLGTNDILKQHGINIGVKGGVRF